MHGETSCDKLCMVHKCVCEGGYNDYAVCSCEYLCACMHVYMCSCICVSFLVHVHVITPIYTRHTLPLPYLLQMSTILTARHIHCLLSTHNHTHILTLLYTWLQRVPGPLYRGHTVYIHTSIQTHRQTHVHTGHPHPHASILCFLSSRVVQFPSVYN